IQPTEVFAHAKMSLNKTISVKDNEESIKISVAIANRSNVDLNAQVKYTLVDPDNQIIRQGSKTVEIFSDNYELRIDLDDFIYQFEKEGNYTVSLSIEGAGIQAPITDQLISVAPNAHIDVDQKLSVYSIPPVEDKNIKVNIQLKGVAK
ncbi:MAG: hypothetical protein OXE99_03300, partial [Cellvibrionales bacterium]|nr:hypothetical protein [Cellvibrionales bacterium]